MRQRIGFRAFRWLGLSLSMGMALAGAAQARQKQAASVRIAEVTSHAATASPAADPVAGAGKEYVIGPEDVLAIDVWREPEISRVEPVRPDGKITLPLAGEIDASGQTTSSLQAEIAQRLTRYIHHRP